MNGRVYDPVLGRFLSADPNVDGVSDAQGFNRYSYVGNNPLGATDPTGFFGLKDALKLVAIIVISVVTAGAALAAYMGVSFGAAIGTMFGVAGAASMSLGGAIVAGAAGGFASGFAGSLLNGGSLGDAFKAGIIGGLVGGISAGLTFEIGSLAKAGSWNWEETALAHGAVQGGITEATGGQFRNGFYAGFVASAAGGLIDQIPGKDLGAEVERVIASAVVGGTASVLGGGKFANGAVSGAFIRLFNEAAHKGQAYAIAGGSGPNKENRAGHFFAGTISSTGVVTVLSYGAAYREGLDVPLALLGYDSDTHVVQNVTNVAELAAWAAQEGYAVYIAPISSDQYAVGQQSILRLVRESPYYSGLLLTGQSCVSVNCSVLHDMGLRSPSDFLNETNRFRIDPSDTLTSSPLVNPSTAVSILSRMSGWSPVH